ncbi:glycosyltransferase [Pseudomonas sp. Irchel s3b5]|uniref:glycosyltransferase n=1 Tax=Pseudomonas sp. Irchel s3b5 TaxID=2009077 RepID=UPI000BA395D8|nr:glycosyltransferase [Pseudomonas sp. Irchel s3b5]
MRIVIDMQGAQTGSRFRGIGRYTMALATAMVKLRGEHDIILVLNGLFPETIDSIRDAFDGLLPQEKIKVWSCVGPVHAFDPSNVYRKDIAELIREEFLASLKADIVHVTSLMEGFGDDAVHSIARAPFKVPTAVTFYDLIPLIKSDVYFAPNPGFERLYREKISHLNRADLMLAISESSREEAVEYLDFSREQVVNISAAVDDIFKPITYTKAASKALSEKYGVRRKYIMYSGATDDRKNHLGLISAYGLLPVNVREEYQLILVGGLPDEHRYRFEQHILKSNLTLQDVIITGRVSDDELVQFYNQCALYVFPSLHEGFGLPVLEAMSCGAAAIGSNTTSVPEVMGNAEALFDPYSKYAIAEKMLQVLNDPLLLQRLREHGIAQAKKFSWENSARLTILAFENWYKISGVQRRKYWELSSEADRRCWLIDEIARLGPVMSDTEIKCIAQAIATHTPVETKQLLVDISGLVREKSRSGIAYISRRLLMELLASPPQGYVVRPIYASDDDFGYRYADKYVSDLKREPEFLEDGYIDICQGDIFLGLNVGIDVQAKQIYFYQYLRRLGISIYFVLHELKLPLKPSECPDDFSSSILYSQDISQFIDGYFCTSQFICQNLASLYVKDTESRARKLTVSWFPLGADSPSADNVLALQQDSLDILSEPYSGIRFLLDTRNMKEDDQHKIISVFERLWTEGFSIGLVMVFKSDGNDLKIFRDRYGNSNLKLLFIPVACDGIYRYLQAACKCFIAASPDERFGASIIEAAQDGLSIIATDNILHKEIAGSHALYFSDGDMESLLSILKEWLWLYKKELLPSSRDIKHVTWFESSSDLKKLIFPDGL